MDWSQSFPAMSRFPGFLIFLLGFALTVLSGCVSGPERPKPRGSQGGFSVLVDGPNHPASARVIADIGAFAQAQGFARQPARSGAPMDPVTREPIPTAPERYLRGEVGLDVSYQPATHRVSAYLHSAESTREIKTIRQFYREFHQQYAPRYGAPDPISETAFSDDSNGPEIPDGPDRAPGIGDTRTQGMRGY